MRANNNKYFPNYTLLNLRNIIESSSVPPLLFIQEGIRNIDRNKTVSRETLKNKKGRH